MMRAARLVVRECISSRLHPAILRAAALLSGATRLTLLLNLPAIEAAGRLDTPGRGSVPLRAPSVLAVGARLGLPVRLRGGSTVAVSGTVTEWVLHHRRGVLINGNDHPVPEIASRLGRNPDVPGSAIVLPLVHGGQVLGVLCVGHHTPDRSALSGSLGGLREELERSARSQVSGALIMLDLDQFKHVNDTYGHLTGDAVIRLIATKAIKGQTRSYDVPCRVGGDEFAVILPHTSLSDALTVAERIRQAVMNAPTDTVGVPVGIVGASLGVAVFPASGISANDLVARADQAMYRAKNLGRNRIQVSGAD